MGEDLCKTCENYWEDFPLPLDNAIPRCDILIERYGLSKDMDDVVPYPCLKCPFDCYTKKK